MTTIMDTPPAGAAPKATWGRWALTCGVIAGPLFTLTWIVESATREHYSVLRHPVSSLQLGDLGWMQTANFLVAGVLSLVFAAGLRRGLRPLGRSTWGPILIGAFAVGLIGSGIFVTDPVSGYPPGTPGMVLEASTHGTLHDLFAIPTFLGLPAACFVFARRFAGWGARGWAVYSAVTGAVFLAMFVLASMAFGQTEGLVDFGGLLQRITITAGWTWLTLLAVRVLRASSGR